MKRTTHETTREKLIACIKAHPAVTRKELAGKIGLTEDGVKYHLTKLTKSRVIRHLGSTKSGRWEALK